MSTKNMRAYVDFEITSLVLSPDEISAILGLSYDKGFSKGDKIIPPKGVWHGSFYDRTAWIISSKLHPNTDLEIELVSILDLVLVKVREINSLPKVSTALRGWVYFEGHPPGFCFDKDTITKLGRLGASLNIELYEMGK